MCFAALLIPSVYSEELKTVSKPDMEGLYSEKPLTRQGTYMQLVEQRNADIKSLIAVLEDKTANTEFNGPFHYAVELLGEYRAVEAIDALMAKILYVPSNFELDEMLSRERYYVCAVALVKIGFPCLEKIYLRMPKAEEKERQLLAWIVSEMLGKEEAIAVLDVQKAKAGKDEAKAAALGEAITHIKEWKPIFERPPESRIRPHKAGSE